MKYPYNKNYRPAFPATEIVLHNPERERRTETVPALLDSGADGTLVPLAYLRQIVAPVIQETRMRSHWGEWRYVEQFLVELEIAQLKVSGILVVGDEVGDEIVLGRDVINKFRVLLDGPNQITDIKG